MSLSTTTKQTLIKNARFHILMLVYDSYKHTLTTSMEYPALSSEFLFDTEGACHLASDCAITELKTDANDVLLTIYDYCTKKYSEVSLESLGYEDVMAILKELL